MKRLREPRGALLLSKEKRCTACIYVLVREGKRKKFGNGNFTDIYWEISEMLENLLSTCGGPVETKNRYFMGARWCAQASRHAFRSSRNSAF